MRGAREYLSTDEMNVTSTRRVMEVIVTRIKPGNEAAYHAVAERFAQAQAAFPGYLGAFTQPPQQPGAAWSTIIGFDSVEHLEAWLESAERAALVEESDALTEGFTQHRIDTSFPGWAPSDPHTGRPPSMWKTAALVLLTLFPVVMLEEKFLYPALTRLDPSLGTFIGNIVSVALTTWPLMPLAIWAFRGWLYPEAASRATRIGYGCALLIAYAAEIALLWRLL